MTVRATIVADSISPAGKRLITWETYYPWQIHGEVMTHRVFSRNASSNRAIPVAKMLEEVRDPNRRAYPSFTTTGKTPEGVNIPGMPGGPPPSPEQLRIFRDEWSLAAIDAANTAEILMRAGAAKQDANRLLMPFTHAHTLISATEVDNFFGLRLDRMADPTMRALAVAMWDAMNFSTPKLLQPGEWHLPFIDDEEVFFATDTIDADDVCKRVSVARCARVSYQEVETQKRSTIEADLALYDRLLAGATKHASPAEHQATPDKLITIYSDTGLHSEKEFENQHEWGNFQEWRQYRKMLPGENCAPLPEGYHR